jgi:hypothetical protein
MKGIVIFCDNAVHPTPKQILGFDLTSQQAEMDTTVEREIERRSMIINAVVKEGEGFELAPGTKVLLYNDGGTMTKRRSQTRPDVYTVLSFKGQQYRLKNDRTNEIVLESRYRMRPI